LVKLLSSLCKYCKRRKKRKIDECLPIDSFTSSLDERNLTSCPIKLIIKTKRHNIYCLSTPYGLRTMKTIITNPSVEDVQNLDNELKIGKQIQHPVFRKSYAITTYQDKKALLLEWANGNPLSDVNKVDVKDFLKIAREIVSCLLEMHANKICHLNLTCDHIILDSVSNSIKMIGYGSSSSFSSKRNHNPKLGGKDARYISPEQTGRVNRDVDFRSDFYSLGVIFYRLLAGRYPFDGQSTMKIVQMHIHEKPLSLHVLDPQIPLPVSDMISKLLEKDMDSRYKSAKGIIHDIDLIMADHDDAGACAD